jgi:hypothetical protein
VELASEGLRIPIYFDSQAWESVGTIVINRIKPHTSFHGPYESGLMKMLVIGLGKHEQALVVHRLGVEGLRDVMPEAAKRVLASANVILGLAIVENAYDETMLVEAIPASLIPEQEPKLLELARSQLPRLPLSNIDILIVDEMGKDVSGLGMDTNVIGRLRIRGQAEPVFPDIKVIIVRDLTSASHGNAAGMGLADIVLRKLFEKIDFAATYENVVTSTFLERGKVPLIAESDRDALEIALRSCPGLEAEGAKIIRIENTLRLDSLQVSPTVLGEIRDHDGIEIAGSAEEMLDPSGNLRPVVWRRAPA